MTKKVSKKTIPPKLPPKKTRSKTTSIKSQKPVREGKSKNSPKASKPISKKPKAESLKASVVNRLKAVALTSKGRRRSKDSKLAVIYGMEETFPNGKKVVHPIAGMKPQKFRGQDLKNLTAMYRKSALAQNTMEPELAFSEVKVPGEFEKTAKGRDRYKIAKAGPLKGKRIPVFKTELKFELPEKSTEYRQVLAKGTKIKRVLHKNFQKRNDYEYVKSEMLGQAGFTKFSDSHSRFMAGHEIANATLKGRTLTEALNKIQVPVSSLWLNENKVVIPDFAKDQVGNIVITGSVKVTTGDTVENVPVNLSVRYLTDIPLSLGRNIRQKLADRGKTFTSPKELAAIASGAWKKLKSMRNGMKTKKAKNEMRRLLHPGFDPHSPHLGGPLKKVLKGKKEAFPLQKTENVSVNLQFAFYSDPLANVKPSKKRAVKKGTKK